MKEPQKTKKVGGATGFCCSLPLNFELRSSNFLLEGQAEAELRRTKLAGGVLQELSNGALLRADPPVRTVERVEDFRDPVDRDAAAQRNPLPEAQVGSVLRGRDQIVTRNDRAVRTEPLAEVCPSPPDIAAVGVRLPDSGSEEMERAHLEAFAHLPDTVQHHAMALIVCRETPLTAEVRGGCEGDLLETAERLRIRIPQT